MKLTVPKKIVVGSPRGLAWATEIAKVLGAEVLAAHVFQLLPQSRAINGPAPIPFSDEWQQEFSHQLVLHASVPVVVIPAEPQAAKAPRQTADEPAAAGGLKQ